ncbi:hypothetical protein [Nocardioides sp. W7]|uniref:phosphotransferase family protein n=1 Tax=Nocardioides sp. W7 TaxID=2931390 RepID=UPI001FD24AD0|nr:hypothetical protein [Nocardioides sp. W7]
MPPSNTPPVPVGRTARRLEWAHLPPHVRALVEGECGSPVIEAITQGGGFTPGFASVLVCADQTRHFVKAASAKAQRAFALSYREEARRLAELPVEAPAPRLLWVHDRDDWVVLGIEYVDAAAPRRPWRLPELEASARMLERVADTLTPPPAAMALDPVADELADWPRAWDHVRTTRPDLPHLEEAATLAAGFAGVSAGDTLVHTDVRDDNVLLAADGRVLLCDWNWPAVGAAWLDTVLLMIGPRGDGLDVDALLARLPLTRDVPADSVDAFLALVTGYFWRQGDERVPPTSPYLRDFQRWQGDVAWDWLAQRRGWS